MRIMVPDVTKPWFRRFSPKTGGVGRGDTLFQDWLSGLSHVDCGVPSDTKNKEDSGFLDENHLELLLLMKKGVWYCSSAYEGCDPLPECGNPVSARMFATLMGKGFVESVPVFDGFMTEKHRITPKGIAWLKAR